MRRILGWILTGILIGYAVGLGVVRLPAPWSIFVSFALSFGIALWTIASMRDLRRRKRIIDEMIANITADLAAKVREEERSVGVKFQPQRKDFGPPLQ